MKYLSVLILIFLSFFSVTGLFAQGESAVPFLLIAPDARPGGMGEAGVATASNATAVWWNPGGLAFQYENPDVDSRGEASLMHVKWLPQFNFSDLWYDFLAARYYIDDIGMIATSITFLNLGKNHATDESGNDLGTFDSFEYALTLSYATKLNENLGLGINLKYIQSNLTDANLQVGAENRDGRSSSFAVDLGVKWIPAYDIFSNRLSFGVNLANIGPKMTYIDEAQADPLPTNLKMGLAYKIIDDEFNKMTVVYDLNKLLVVRNKEGSDGVFKAMFYSAWVEKNSLKKIQHSVGLEYWYGNLIALRAGYFYEDANYGGRQFMTFGAGLKYYIFGIDFGYISASEDHPLSDTMRFSVLIEF